MQKGDPSKQNRAETERERLKREKAQIEAAAERSYQVYQRTPLAVLRALAGKTGGGEARS